MPRLKHISLQSVILLLTILPIILTLIFSIIASYQVQKQTLIDNTLLANEMYAKKIAKTTDDFLTITMDLMKYSANEIGKSGMDQQRLNQEANRLHDQINVFDTVVISNEKGMIVSASNNVADVIGKPVKAKEAIHALQIKKPYVSNPYEAPYKKKLQIMVSVPIFNDHHEYKGFVSGRIYIQENNFLDSILEKHYYQDQSNIYVVDANGRIIYHTDRSRINENVSKNKVVQEVIHNHAGSMHVKNTKGKDMLAGYSHIQYANWGVIAERPLDDALKPLSGMVWKTFLKLFSFAIVLFIIAWRLSIKIIEPLKKLSQYAESISSGVDHKLEVPEIPTCYYEAKQLRKTIITSISLLHNNVNRLKKESMTDPLTGLVNRRTIEDFFKHRELSKEPFSMLFLDIDHFKFVNDTFGHDVGDLVLKQFASDFKMLVRQTDICARWGGEEFMIILPQAKKEAAFQVAEKIRKHIMNSPNPTGKQITISIGVAEYPLDDQSVQEVIKLADHALYEAKQSGRNKTIMARPNRHS